LREKRPPATRKFVAHLQHRTFNNAIVADDTYY
jgi:hypothetical protein